MARDKLPAGKAKVVRSEPAAKAPVASSIRGSNAANDARSGAGRAAPEAPAPGAGSRPSPPRAAQEPPPRGAAQPPPRDVRVAPAQETKAPPPREPRQSLQRASAPEASAAVLPARSSSSPPPAIGSSRARGRPRGPFTQHRRLDALRALLQRHPKGLTIYELASELDVTPRSMRRYLAEVRREMEITPTLAKPGGERVWRLAPGELGRRVEVRRTQAYALLAAQRLFEPMKGSTLYEEIDMVAQKLLGVARRPGRGPNAGVADARLEERFLYLPFAPKDYSSRTEELDALFQAVADLRPLRCRYRRAKDGREDRIVIHPYAMVLYKDSIYCVGLHVGRGEVRTFLLDRMRDAECATIERFGLPDDFSIEDHFQGQFGIFRGGQPQRVVVDFDPRVAEYVRTRRVHPSQEISALPDGGVRLSMAIGDLTEVGTWILGFGETAKVIEPAELVERVRKELTGALAQYAVSTAPAPTPTPAPGPVISVDNRIGPPAAT